MGARIAAIPTNYQGVQMRSKLEADTAALLDRYRIPWTYETEGYDCDGVWYLPDFYLPRDNTFLEAKGILDTGSVKKIEALTKALAGTGRGVMWVNQAHGIPPPPVWARISPGSMSISSRIYIAYQYWHCPDVPAPFTVERALCCCTWCERSEQGLAHYWWHDWHDTGLVCPLCGRGWPYVDLVRAGEESWYEINADRTHRE